MDAILNKNYDDKNQLVEDLSKAVEDLSKFYQINLRKCANTSDIYTFQHLHSPQASTISRGRWNKDALADAEKELYNLVNPSLGISPLNKDYEQMAKDTIKYIRVTIPAILEDRRQELSQKLNQN